MSKGLFQCDSIRAEYKWDEKKGRVPDRYLITFSNVGEMEWDRGVEGIWLVGEGASFELSTPVNACELGKKYWLELKAFEGHIDVEDTDDAFSGQAFDESTEV
jgi:hypothetical protein